MDYNNLLFKELCVGECFLPTDIVSKMSAQYLLTVQKNKKYFTKEEHSIVNTNGNQIAANAKFNGSGNFVFVDEHEPVIHLYVLP
jgi:hypothetical protein